MKRCPACCRYGVKYNSDSKHEKCVYCNWLNVDDVNLNKVKHPFRFIKAIFSKTGL